MKLKGTVYFVTRVHKMLLYCHNQSCSIKNIYRQKDRGAYDLQNTKRVVILYFNNFYSLILEDNIVFYLSFVIIYGNFLKYIAARAQILQ